jgi:hypothetical protein
MSTAKERREPFIAENGDWNNFNLSLVKLVGQPIKDIYGYIDTEGDPVFLMCEIILEDGSKFWAEGEHDRPYLYSSPMGNSAKYLVDLETLVDEEEAYD